MLEATTAAATEMRSLARVQHPLLYGPFTSPPTRRRCSIGGKFQFRFTSGMFVGNSQACVWAGYADSRTTNKSSATLGSVSSPELGHVGLRKALLFVYRCLESFSCSRLKRAVRQLDSRLWRPGAVVEPIGVVQMLPGPAWRTQTLTVSPKRTPTAPLPRHQAASTRGPRCPAIWLHETTARSCRCGPYNAIEKLCSDIQKTNEWDSGDWLAHRQYNAMSLGRHGRSRYSRDRTIECSSSVIHGTMSYSPDMLSANIADEAAACWFVHAVSLFVWPALTRRRANLTLGRTVHR